MTLLKKIAAAALLLSLPLISAFLLPGCASGPANLSSQSTLTFSVAVNERGQLDTGKNGYYAILLNSFDEEIDVTNYETFTDFIRYDGFNFTWYHRQGNVPSPGYTFVNAGNLNADAVVNGDNTGFIIRINLKDQSHIFNQYIQSSRFTTHIVTTDRNNSLLGRTLDTLGQGPAVDGNTLYTVFFDETTGVIQPIPQDYPVDPLGDWDEKSDLSSDYPYENFDIEKFSVELE
ncbi:MAG: hypothetical protein LWY06_16145 [Firmicutes bacterium]|nr:hypothetical protein [Bacillota bacterium]